MSKSKEKRKDRFFADYHDAIDSDVSFSPENDHLPVGIGHIGCSALYSERLMDECDRAIEAAKANGEPVKVAAFDFDGTCIDTSSPRKLVMSLWRHNLIEQHKALRVAGWGLAYKLDLPRDEEAVRRRVFSVFKGRNAASINRFLSEFYFRKVDPYFREDADAAMAAHLDEGHIVVLVSATFEPLMAAAMTAHPIQFSISSRMKIDSFGNYTDQIDGIPVDGSDKVVVLSEFLNERFKDVGWEIEFAYGDHTTDIPMLSQARFPCAVDPDPRLKRYAISQGWDILDWQ